MGVEELDFDLFELHDPKDDKKPYFWTKIGGKEIQSLFEDLVNNICKTKNVNKNELAKELSKELGCCVSLLQKYFYSKRDLYPIPLINRLLDLLENENKKMQMKSLFSKKIEYLKIGGSSQRQRAVKYLTPEQAKLCGAIVADGCLVKSKVGEHGIVIRDYYKKALAKTNAWFNQALGISSVVRKDKGKPSHFLKIDNKIAANFFNKFFEIPFGKKSAIVKEPQIIKHSPYRLDFAEGALLFDGSVELDYLVSYGTISKKLAEDLLEILTLNGFEIELRYFKTTGLYRLRTKRLTREQTDKWIAFFGKDTEKGSKLYQMTYGFPNRVGSVGYFMFAISNFCNFANSSKISIKDVFAAIKENNCVTKATLKDILRIGTSTLYKYLWILEKTNSIKAEKFNGGENRENKYSYNPNIWEWRAPSKL